MLSEAQRDVLRRIRDGGEIQSEFKTCCAPYEVHTWMPVAITDEEVVALREAGLIEVTLWYDGPRIYGITDAGRAAIGAEES
jgi:hypothetical protein